jgi:hypothetical protein
MSQQPSYDPYGYQGSGYPDQGGYYYQQPQQPYAPPQQYQPSGYYQPPPPPAGTNGWAVASLIFGILGGILLSVIFGIIALVQIPKRRQKGKGLAITGLVLSGLWVLGIVAAVVVAINTSADRDADGDIVSGGSVSVTELKAGDCFNGLTENGTVIRVNAVPCAEPHDAEVFAVFELAGTEFPGDDKVFEDAEKGCNDRLPDYSNRAVEDASIELYVFHPTRQSWARGDHEVTCIVGSPSQKITGSLKD